MCVLVLVFTHQEKSTFVEEMWKGLLDQSNPLGHTNIITVAAQNNKPMLVKLKKIIAPVILGIFCICFSHSNYVFYLACKGLKVGVSQTKGRNPTWERIALWYSLSGTVPLEVSVLTGNV